MGKDKKNVKQQKEEIVSKNAFEVLGDEIDDNPAPRNLGATPIPPKAPNTASRGTSRFPNSRVQRIANASLDLAHLETTPVQDFLTLFVI